MAAPTAVTDTTISTAPITAATPGISTQVATPASLTAAQKTAQTGTASQATAQTGAVSTPAQVAQVTGTLTGTATGAIASPNIFCSCSSSTRTIIFRSFSSSCTRYFSNS